MKTTGSGDKRDAAGNERSAQKRHPDSPGVDIVAGVNQGVSISGMKALESFTLTPGMKAKLGFQVNSIGKGVVSGRFILFSPGGGVILWGSPTETYMALDVATFMDVEVNIG